MSKVSPEELERFREVCATNRNGIFPVIPAGTKLRRRTTTSSSEDSASPIKTYPEAAAAEPATPKGLSTREAEFFDVAPETRPATPEEKTPSLKIAISPFRRKEIKYGNHNAMWESLSAQLYALTGMLAPDVKLAHEPSEENPKIGIFSPMIPGYLDLGTFLIDDVARNFIHADHLVEWEKQKLLIEEINEKEKVTAADKSKRIKAMNAIYEMLPSNIHHEIEMAFAASKFVGNWDFANFNLANIGLQILDGEKVKAVFVDFGNCGAIGFGGKYKEESFDRANTEAKTRRAKPDDFDPALEFTAAERGFLEAKTKDLEPSKVISTLWQELVDGKYDSDPTLEKTVRSILFKDAHHILKCETSLKTPPTVGLLTLSDTPRNLPFSGLFRNVVSAKTQAASGFALGALFSDSEIEMAFRLSLIPDDAIMRVVAKCFLSEEFPTIFEIPDSFKTNPNYNTAAGVGRIFVERKMALIKTVPETCVAKWVEKNPTRARAVQEDVELAIAERLTASSRGVSAARGEAAFEGRYATKAATR